MRKSNLTPPNILSAYRLLSFPVVLSLAWQKVEFWFVLLFCINLITDILDGLLARSFNWQTEFGARLDSIADVGTFILAFIGIYIFKWQEMAPYSFSFILYFSLFIFAMLFSLLKFRRFPSLHLYSWKIGGYIQGSFFFVLFVFGFNVHFYFFMITWSILATLEEILVLIKLKELKSNRKGLYWVLKNID